MQVMQTSGCAEPGGGSFGYTSCANMTRGIVKRNPEMIHLQLDDGGSFS
jgi:hypothetical protein